MSHDRSSDQRLDMRRRRQRGRQPRVSMFWLRLCLSGFLITDGFLFLLAVPSEGSGRIAFVVEVEVFLCFLLWGAKLLWRLVPRRAYLARRILGAILPWIVRLVLLLITILEEAFALVILFAYISDPWSSLVAIWMGLLVFTALFLAYLVMRDWVPNAFKILLSVGGEFWVVVSFLYIEHSGGPFWLQWGMIVCGVVLIPTVWWDVFWDS